MSKVQALETELMEYAKAHLLEHMRDSGMSREEIEAKIASMSPYHPLKPHFVEQFVRDLSSDEAEKVRKRLLPFLEAQQMKVTVLTAPGKPTFEVPAYLESFQISAMVLENYGKQESGETHVWMGDPIN